LIFIFVFLYLYRKQKNSSINNDGIDIDLMFNDEPTLLSLDETLIGEKKKNIIKITIQNASINEIIK
jgi:hypothetical protein